MESVVKKRQKAFTVSLTAVKTQMAVNLPYDYKLLQI